MERLDAILIILVMLVGVILVLRSAISRGTKKRGNKETNQDISLRNTPLEKMPLREALDRAQKMFFAPTVEGLVELDTDDKACQLVLENTGDAPSVKVTYVFKRGKMEVLLMRHLSPQQLEDPALFRVRYSFPGEWEQLCTELQNIMNLQPEGIVGYHLLSNSTPSE